jgi:signal transduction histidine kinase
MLHDFVQSRREELISRTRAKVSARASPSTSTGELQHGVPLFLTQLSETLRLETTAAPFSPTAIAAGAASHGRELLAEGYSISQVVHDYADVCQAITGLAVEQGVTISPEEFHTLNRCLDTAIAEAVTEYGRVKEEAALRKDLRHRGAIAHDLRNFVQTALLSFQVLKADKGGASGGSAGVLGRSLVHIRDLADGIVSEVRLAASARRHDRVSLLAFVDEIAVAAQLHAQCRDIQLTVEPVDAALAIDVDTQLLASAVMNLVHNAFQYTHAHGRVTIRAHAEHGRAFIDVEDECGGLRQGATEQAVPFGDRRRRERAGLGLGLSISRRAVTANGGEIHTRDLPGKGCIFTIELPLATPAAAWARAAASSRDTGVTRRGSVP